MLAGDMERHEVVGVGLGAAGVGLVYAGIPMFGISALQAVLTVVTGVALLESAAGFAAGDAWGAGIGAATAGAASLWYFRGLLVQGVVSIWSVAGFLHGLGLLLLPLALVAWARSRSPDAAEDPEIEPEEALLGFRAACLVVAASSLLYGVANVVYWDPVFLPVSLLVVPGFALAAWQAQAPLFGEDDAVDGRPDGPNLTVEG